VKIAAMLSRGRSRSLFICRRRAAAEQGVEICNMRTESAEQVVEALLSGKDVTNDR